MQYREDLEIPWSYAVRTNNYNIPSICKCFIRAREVVGWIEVFDRIFGFFNLETTEAFANFVWGFTLRALRLAQANRLILR